MGCFPHALLMTIKDATDGGVGYHSSPASRSPRLPPARPGDGGAGTPGAALGSCSSSPPRRRRQTASPPAPAHRCRWTGAAAGEATQPRAPSPPHGRHVPPAAAAAEVWREAAGGPEGRARGAGCGLGLLNATPERRPCTRGSPVTPAASPLRSHQPYATRAMTGAAFAWVRTAALGERRAPPISKPLIQNRLEGGKENAQRV